MSTKIALFASGSGSNAENIIRYFKDNKEFEFPLILSNNPKAYIHERARALDVPTFTFSREEFANAEEIIRILHDNKIDLIVLAGFMLKISPKLIDFYPNRIINIHPALLPKYGGKGMYGDHVHKAVVEAGETKSGITIHYINENYDEGNIIFQAECELSPSDSPVDVAAKVHSLEYEHYPRIIEKIARIIG